MAVVLTFSAACSLLAAPAFGQGRDAGVGLDDAVAIALRNNPDIVAARLRVDSARGEQQIARALPDLLLTISPQLPYQYIAGTIVDLGPRRTYRTQAAGRGVAAAGTDTAEVRRQVVFAVRQAFFDALLAAAQRAIAVERRDIFRQLLAADSSRVRNGDLAERELARSAVEFARADADVTRGGASVHTSRLTLQLLMGADHPDTALALRGALSYHPIPVATDSLIALAELNRADLRAAHQRREQSQSLVRLAGAERIPAPFVSVVYQPGAPFASGSNYALGLGVSVPLFSWHGGERERASAGLAAAELAERRTRAQIVTEVQSAIDGYGVNRSLADRYDGGLLAQAQAALETMRYAYRAGAVSLLDLLDAIRTYSEIHSDYNSAVHDYWVSVFALGRAVGKDLVP